MPLETATHISDLVVTNPAASDGLSQGDDHLRMIKSVLKTDFPAITGPVTLTQAQINALPTNDIGAITAFPLSPAGFVNTGAAGGKWLECNGAQYNIADYPTLGSLYAGQGWGGAAPAAGTFKTPNLNDTGRFLRHRSPNFGNGVPQAQLLASHAHAVNGVTLDNSVDHSHTQQGTFGSTNNLQTLNHTHLLPYSTTSRGDTGGVATFSYVDSIGAGPNVTSTGASGDIAHNHNVTVSGQTSGASVVHQHGFSVTSQLQPSGGFETRPEAFTVIYCVKTGL